MTVLSGCKYGCVPCTCQSSTQTSCTSWPCAWKFTSPFDGITYILREQGVDAWLDKTGKWSLIYGAAPPVSYTLSDGTNKYLMAGPVQNCCNPITLTNIAGNPNPASITVTPLDCGCCPTCSGSVAFMYRASTCVGSTVDPRPGHNVPPQTAYGCPLSNCAGSDLGQVCVCVYGTVNYDQGNDPQFSECCPCGPAVYSPNCLSGSTSDTWTLTKVFIGNNQHGVPVYWADLYKNGVKVHRYENQWHNDVAIQSVTNLCSCTLEIDLASSTGQFKICGSTLLMMGNGTVSASISDPCNTGVTALINGKPSPATVNDGQQVTLTLQNNQAICCQMSGPVCKSQQAMVGRIEPLPSARPPEMPSMLTRAKNFSAALLAHAGDRFGKTTLWERARRRSICERCPLFRAKDNVCMKCGCKGGGMLLDMWAMRSKHCPDDPPKW